MPAALLGGPRQRRHHGAAGTVGLTRGIGTFDQQGQCLRQECHIIGARRLRQLPQTRQQALFVAGHHAARGMRAAGKFHRDIDERAAPIAGRGRARGQVDEQLPQLRARLAGMLGEAGIEIRPEFRVSAQQVLPQQILFGLELPVQAHLVDARALDHRVDAHVAGALEVKEIFRGVQDLRMRNRTRGDPALSRLMSGGQVRFRLKGVDNVTARSLACRLM